jgi:hypothetical protein
VRCWCVTSLASLHTHELTLEGQSFAQSSAILSLSSIPNFVCNPWRSVAQRCLPLLQSLCGLWIVGLHLALPTRIEDTSCRPQSCIRRYAFSEMKLVDQPSQLSIADSGSLELFFCTLELLSCPFLGPPPNHALDGQFDRTMQALSLLTMWGARAETSAAT